jgi:hypothetical protein
MRLLWILALAELWAVPWCRILSDHRRFHWALDVYYEIKPFYLPAVLVFYGYLWWTHPKWWFSHLFWAGICFFYWWWLNRIDDDDRWRRRRRAAMQRIRRVGSRLVVEDVPT